MGILWLTNRAIWSAAQTIHFGDYDKYAQYIGRLIETFLRKLNGIKLTEND